MSNIADTQKKILESDDFVLSEIKKIQYAYELKHVTRYDVNREEEIKTESVAEHVYALHLLMDYFLPLEDPEGTLDYQKVRDMLQYHDIDEIETGDMVGYLKTEAQQAAEVVAAEKVVAGFPDHIQEKVKATIQEYDELVTPEAKFAKALDRLEPEFQLCCAAGKGVMQKLKCKREQHIRIKRAYVEPYPYMLRFHEVSVNEMDKLGFFTSD